jgi:hypothetical protein
MTADSHTSFWMCAAVLCQGVALTNADTLRFCLQSVRSAQSTLTSQKKAILADVASDKKVGGSDSDGNSHCTSMAPSSPCVCPGILSL